MNSNFRAALVLRDVEGMPYEEISEILEISLGTVKSRILRGRDALKERTRERVPIDWAASSGGQGVAMMLIADRTNNGAMAETAFHQIQTAVEMLWSTEHKQWAAYFNEQLTEAQAIRDRLKGE